MEIKEKYSEVSLSNHSISWLNQKSRLCLIFIFNRFIIEIFQVSSSYQEFEWCLWRFPKNLWRELACLCARVQFLSVGNPADFFHMINKTFSNKKFQIPWLLSMISAISLFSRLPMGIIRLSIENFSSILMLETNFIPWFSMRVWLFLKMGEEL